MFLFAQPTMTQMADQNLPFTFAIDRRNRCVLTENGESAGQHHETTAVHTDIVTTVVHAQAAQL
uniref:Uncharacterized protein n=1 Tax=Oryza brachyantha TaxID=4533 RepID=J3N810_ORYBR